MGTIECSQPTSKSSWDSQDFGDISMVLKMAHFRKSTGPRWVKGYIRREKYVYSGMPLWQNIWNYNQSWLHFIDRCCLSLDDIAPLDATASADKVMTPFKGYYTSIWWTSPHFSNFAQ